MTTCPNHRVVMVSSETVYASQYASIATVSKEVYTFMCHACGCKKELVINHKTK